MLNKISDIKTKHLHNVAIIVLLLCTKIFYAQNYQSFEINGKDTINKVDMAGKRQGYWIITNILLKKECYADDQKVEEGKYIDSKKTGFWKEYFCNKNLKSKIFYDNNRPNGYAIIYHENGKIKEEGTWKNNRWVGAYKLYYSNGQVQQAFNFNAAGKREGKQTYYHPNGQVMIEGNWDGGKEAGPVKEYYENGDLKSIKDFSGGVIDPNTVKTFEPKKPIAPKPVIPEEEIEAPPVVVQKNEKDNLGKVFNGEGYWQLYNGNKQITKDGVFKGNRLIDGKAYFYDDDGLLLRIAIYKGGKYIGDGVLEE